MLIYIKCTTKKSEFRGIRTISVSIFFSFSFCLKNYITPTNQQLVVSYQHIALSPNVNYLIDISAYHSCACGIPYVLGVKLLITRKVLQTCIKKKVWHFMHYTMISDILYIFICCCLSIICTTCLFLHVCKTVKLKSLRSPAPLHMYEKLFVWL